MRVLVDTSVWSLALRRQPQAQHPAVNILKDLILDGRAMLIGVVRQELLSGIREEAQFQRLKQYLKAFADVELSSEDYETAAEYFNLCRKVGIQGSQADFLIAAASVHRKWLILSTDQDFLNYQQHVPLQLYRRHRKTSAFRPEI